MPEEVILMFDLAGVLTSSPYPAVRRLAEAVLRCVFERAAAHLISIVDSESPALLAHHYSNFFHLIWAFTEKVRGVKSAYERLELGEINRLQFIPMFYAEMNFMLTALSKKNPEEVEALCIANPARLEALRRRYPLLADPIVQELLHELVDAEAFLSTIERVSPRRNVMNLLHYLRTKSQQEIRLVVITNTWEVEGQYAHMTKILSSRFGDSSWSYFPDTCPIDYGNSKGRASFPIYGLFDAYIQSYTLHKRKPFPDIFLHAIEEAKRTCMESAASLRLGVKPHIFLFEENVENCEAARNLPDSPFEKVYCIENGAFDVFRHVVDALKTVGENDPFWADVIAGVESEIAPLFKPPRDTNGQPMSWVNEEIHDCNSNLIFPSPPLCEVCDPQIAFSGSPFLDDDSKDSILFYFAQHLPHLFPIDVPRRYTCNIGLARKPGFATSSGPILFEKMSGIGFCKTYRITLRTGSYVLRLQPRGPTPYGILDIRTEHEVMQYLNRKSSLPVARCYLYCDSYATCGYRFSLRRFVDGEVLTNITKLIQPRIHRPYSQRRQKVVNLELDPFEFFKKAVDILDELHSIPLSSFMSKQQIERQRVRGSGSCLTHPLLEFIRGWTEKCKTVVAHTKYLHSSSLFCLTSLERLTSRLIDCFSATRVEERIIPFPERSVIIHGDYKLRDLLFSQRSFEGRYKYPPQVLAVMNFAAPTAGDPLIDVANLALVTLVAPPRGVCGMSSKVQALFPSPEWILERYCSVRRYMRGITKARREAIFAVYLAAMCLRHAISMTLRLVDALTSRKKFTVKDERMLCEIEHVLQQGLNLIDCEKSHL